MTGLDIYGSTLGNSLRHRRLTRYELCQWGSSTPIKSAEKMFSTLIYAGVMALVSRKSLEILVSKDKRSQEVDGMLYLWGSGLS